MAANLDKQQARLIGLDFFRFFFIIWICLFHFETPFATDHANIAVEFFFIVSGFFLTRTWKKGSLSPFEYTKNRIERLFPPYIVALILTYAITIIRNLNESSLEIHPNDYLFAFISESSLLQETGWFSLSFGFTTWFVSALVIAGYFIYAFLYSCQKTAFSIILPITIITGYTAIASNNCTLTGAWGTEATSQSFVFLPLCRALAGIALGSLIYHILDITKGGKTSQWILVSLHIIGLILITYYGFFVKKNYDFYAIILFVLILIPLLKPDSPINRVFKSRLWVFLGGISYEMFLLHIPIKSIINFFNGYITINHGLLTILYLVITVLAAWGLKVSISHIKHRQSI